MPSGRRGMRGRSWSRPSVATTRTLWSRADLLSLTLTLSPLGGEGPRGMMALGTVRICSFSKWRYDWRPSGREIPAFAFPLVEIDFVLPL